MIQSLHQQQIHGLELFSTPSELEYCHLKMPGSLASSDSSYRYDTLSFQQMANGGHGNIV